MISDPDKFIFIHIPKTAGRSIEAVLRKRFKHATTRSQDPNWSWTTQHDSIIEYDVSMTNPLSDYFTFAFVRNPWSRIVSLWKHLQCPKVPGKPSLGWANIAGSSISSIGFEEFVFNFAKIIKGAQNAHWWNPYRKYMFTAPQLNFITNENNEMNLDFIGRFENLQNDFEHVCKKLNIDKATLPHVNKTPMKKKPYQEYYQSQKCIDEVAKLYKKDIDFFKYDF